MTDKVFEDAQQIIDNGHTITAQQAEESGVGGSGSAYKDIKTPSDVTSADGGRKVRPLITKQLEDEVAPEH